MIENSIVPEAYFDALAIMHDAPESVVPISVIELHLYAYLACIFALFKGQPIGDWGYTYAITSEGFPFSAEFEEARRTVVAAGLIEEDQGGLLTARARQVSAELDTILSFGPWATRRPWLRAATECALALPVGSIRYAVSQSPGIAHSLRLGQRRQLLEKDDIDLLYSEYGIVTSVLGSSAQDLLSPAVIWLSARVLRSEDLQLV